MLHGSQFKLRGFFVFQVLPLQRPLLWQQHQLQRWPRCRSAALPDSLAVQEAQQRMPAAEPQQPLQVLILRHIPCLLLAKAAVCVEHVLPARAPAAVCAQPAQAAGWHCIRCVDLASDGSLYSPVIGVHCAQGKALWGLTAPHVLPKTHISEKGMEEEPPP